MRKVGERMKTSYAVVDLETTGPKFEEGGRIFQFGCSIIEQGEIVTQVDLYINPETTIPYEIQQLTGVDKKEVKQAPYFDEIASTIFQLLEGKTFVAHNISFDYSYLVESFRELAGIEWSAPCVDTVQLAQICYPTIESYRLQDLTQLLEIPHQQIHSAGSDAYATAQLFLNCIKELEQLPAPTLQQMSLFADSLMAETGKVIHDCCQNASLTPKEFIFIEGFALNPIVETDEQDEKTQKWNALELYHQLVKKQLIEYQPLQVQLIEFMLERLNYGHSISWMEAEPGLGKTLAYLLVSLQVQSQNHPIWIATSTILLQQQILEQEIKPLEEGLGISFPIATVKGQEHYLSLSGFREVLEKYDQYQNQKSALTVIGLLKWLAHTTSGDLSECNALFYHREIWEKITRKERQLCKMDFYRRAIRHAKNSKIVITNQAFLVQYLKQASQRDHFDKPIVIMDEVQHLEHALESQEQKLLEFEPLWQVQMEWNEYHLEHYLEMPSTQEHQSRQINRRLLEICDLYEEWMQIIRKESYPTSVILLSSEEWVKSIHHQTLAAMKVACIDLLKRTFEFKGNDELVQRTHTCLQKMVQEMVLLLKQEEGYVAVSTVLKKGQYSLQLESMKSALKIWREIQPYIHQFIGVSATIPIFTPLFHSILKQEDGLFLPKIYQNFEHHILIPTDLPTPSIIVTLERVELLVSQLVDIYQRKQGRCLVLVHSIEMLEELEQVLLEYPEIPLLVQRTNQSSRKVQRKFQQQESVLLLGVYSFWEGFDSGDVSIDQLIIPKLPFPNPTQLQQRVIAEEMKLQNRHYFQDYALEKMLQQFYQGLGRMNRPHQERAEIWILDTRSIHSPYSTRVMQCIPNRAKIYSQTFRKLIKKTMKE